MSYLDLEQNFYGRDEILELLRRRVIDFQEDYRQNVALIGSRYVGKSSILRHFMANLDEPKVNVIYLDLEHRDFGYVYIKFCSSLLYNFSRLRSLPLHDELNLLLENTKTHIPQSVEIIQNIKKLNDKGKVHEAFLGLLMLVDIFTKESGMYCVLVLDEFQNLEEMFSEHIFQDLGKRIMMQKKCLYVLSSSSVNAAQKILADKLSLLFGNFDVVEVKPFDLQSSQELIGFNLGDIKIGLQLRNLLIDFTGGHPLYINLICQELISLSAIYNQNEIYLPLLAQAIENTLFDRWGVISRHFEIIIKDIQSLKGNKLISPILITMSNGMNKSNEIMDSVGIKRGQLSQRMNKLIEAGVIVKNGNVYYFKDKLFKYWVKFIYQKRLMDVELFPDNQRKKFKEEFQNLVDHFKDTAKKDFAHRIIELLNCFDNELLNINGRRYKLPLFKDFVSFKLKDGHGIYYDMIRAKSEKSDWFIVMKKEPFGEQDVGVVLEETKKISQKPHRCLMITLSDFDHHTKLRALQEKFWIWNQTELNEILNLFNKPFILR